MPHAVHVWSRTFTPWGPSARAVSLTISREMPPRNVLLLFFTGHGGDLPAGAHLHGVVLDVLAEVLAVDDEPHVRLPVLARRDQPRPCTHHTAAIW